jgi:hypothetical protein
MHTIATRDPGSQEELAEIMAEIPWRFEHFYDQILSALSDI